jgi:small-conductance mechanosensitive channel
MTNNSMLAQLTPPDVDIDLPALWAQTHHWFQHHWMRILIAGGIAMAIIVALYSLRALAVRYCNRDRPGPHDWWLVFGRTVARTMRSFIVLAALQTVMGIADPPSGVARVVRALFTISAVFQGAIWARELILGAVERRTGDDRYATEALSSAMGIIRLLVTFAVFAIALIVVLDNLGVNVTGLVAGLGVGGIAIGLAAQGIFADLFAALAIILDRPFRRGDTISYDQTTGTVEEIGLKSTRLRAPTGEELIIANKQLLEKEIHNISLRHYRRIKFTLALIYQTPPDTARGVPEMLKDIVEEAGGTFVRAGFANFGANSLDFELEFDGPVDLDATNTLRHTIGLAIVERFAAKGIKFAYPTQTSFTAAPDGTLVMPYAVTPGSAP